MVFEVPLTRGMVALVDDEDADLVSEFSWHARKGTHTWYAEGRERGRRQDPRKHLAMHSLIMGCRVDHINGSGLDNRRENLRPVTQRQNQWNRQNSWGRSRFKGVYWHKQDQRWWAAITVDGKRISLWTWEHEEDAAKAYDRAARKHFGEYAALNFPEPGEQGVRPKESV